MKRLLPILFLLLSLAPMTRAQTEAFTIPGLDGEITITFDALGIPTIDATTARDAFAGQGFVHASDRWWQMDVLRHSGEGRLAELVGIGAVERDKLMRTIGIARHADQNLTLLSDEGRGFIDAYTAGVNAWIEGKTPAELAPQYDLLPEAVTIEAWEPRDTMIIQSLQALGFNNGSLFVEVFKSIVMEEAGTLGVNLLLPPYPYDSLPVIMEPGGKPAETTSNALWQMATMSLLLPDMTGSNNWVVSGDLSATGRPLLANDTHMGVNIPSFWYENALRGGDLDVYGMSIAGTPGVVIGHNQNVGWGMTSSQTDMTDFYLLDMTDENQYRYNGDDVELEILPEPIRVAGGETVDFSVSMTVFGPVFTEFEGYALQQPAALHWVNADGNRSLDAVFGLNHASDWETFEAAVALFDVPGLNFVYADVEGNIGYILGGLIPKRVEGHDGSLPVEGVDASNRWQGYVDPLDNPRLFNPPTGYIFTANNAVIRPDDYPYPVAQFYDYGYRAARIESLLQAEDQHSVESFAVIQFDHYNPAADLLMPALKELTFENEQLNDAVVWLGEWDKQNDADSPQAALFNVFWSKLLKLALDEAPVYEPAHTLRMMDIILANPIHPIWSNSTENLFSREDILKRAFTEAWDELVTNYGDDREAWRYGAFHVTRFVPTVLTYLNGGVETKMSPVVASSGGFSSPNVANWDPNRDNYEVINIPTMRMILDFSDFSASRFVNSTGQSDNPDSPHYADQIEMWAAGEYHAHPTEPVKTWVIR